MIEMDKRIWIAILIECLMIAVLISMVVGLKNVKGNNKSIECYNIYNYTTVDLNINYSCAKPLCEGILESGIEFCKATTQSYNPCFMEEGEQYLYCLKVAKKEVVRNAYTEVFVRNGETVEIRHDNGLTLDWYNNLFTTNNCTVEKKVSNKAQLCIDLTTKNITINSNWMQSEKNALLEKK